MKRALIFAAVALTVIVLSAFMVLAVRGLVDPVASAARFGLPVSDPAGMLYFRVYLSRNLVIAMAASAFLLFRWWKPLAMLITLATALPAFDATVLALHLQERAPLAVHIATFIALAVTAAALWLCAWSASPARMSIAASRS